MGEFVGGRIVPKHCGVWNKNTKYEMLSIVYQPETGNSYISRKNVPAGTALSSEEYWALFAEYSAQVHQLELDVDADVEKMHTDVKQTKTAMSQELSETHEAISQELSESEQRIQKNLQDTTSNLTGQVNAAKNDLAVGRMDLETTKNQLTARMNSIVSGKTTDTELLDARVNSEGNTYGNLSERLKAIDAFYADSDAETLDGTVHGSLASYIHEEWRTDFDLIRGNALHKGSVDVTGVKSGEDMSGCIDPEGDGYYLLIPTGALHDVGKNVLFYGLRGKHAIMRGRWGGSADDFHYAGTLSVVPAQHFREMEDGAIMMLTSIGAWNGNSAKYLYINLTEENVANARAVICDTEGNPLQNCLTELLNRMETHRDRKAVRREKTLQSQIAEKQTLALEPIERAVAENKTAIGDLSTAMEKKFTNLNEDLDERDHSLEESIEQALVAQNSNWRGKTINFIGDSITYGAYTPVGGTSPNMRAEKRYCEVACERLGATCRNYGVSGISISSTSYQSPTGAISLRYTRMDNAADMVVIAGGTNDYGTGVTLGTIADTTDVSFYGALHVLCNGLCEKYPGKRIVFITPFHRSSEAANKAGATLAQYRQAIFEVARDEFGFAVLDGWSVGLSTKNTKLKAEYIVDGVHPNPIGHELIGVSIAHMLNAL